jgi:hypothetical protein|uniref:Apple domain-containing protein n=1 Tax=viral metagenome TaxID=1070528 RepID=A0A6C0DSF3_9ZZZZ
MGDQQIQSAVLKLETLQKQFSLAMNQYKTAVASYTNEITNPNQKYTYIPNSFYLGWPLLKIQNVANEKACEALCSSDPNCKGATYYYLNSKPNTKYCITSSGTSKPFPIKLPGVNVGVITPSSQSAQLYLEKIKELNTNLTSLHSQILNTLKDINPTYQSIVSQTQVQGNNLNQVYMSLLDEKYKIDQLLAEYNTLDHVQNDTALQVESNYMYYRIVFIIAIIIAFFAIKQVIANSASSSGMTGGGKASLYDILFNFILMILLLFLAHAFQHSAGYILWALLVLAYVLVKIKVLPKFK